MQNTFRVFILKRIIWLLGILNLPHVQLALRRPDTLICVHEYISFPFMVLLDSLHWLRKNSGVLSRKWVVNIIYNLRLGDILDLLV